MPATGTKENLKLVSVPVEVEPAPDSSTAPPSSIVVGVAVMLATGGACTVTVTKAGALTWPRLSVTTREN